MHGPMCHEEVAWMIQEDCVFPFIPHGGYVLTSRVTNPKTARLLVEHAPSVASYVDGFGREPLHYAVTPEIARIWRAYGGNPRSVDQYGQTPMHVAAREGRVDVVAWLMDMGIRDLDHAGNMPIHEAAMGGHMDVVHLFVEKDPSVMYAENSKGYTPVLMAAAAGKKAVVEFLANRDASIVYTTPLTHLITVMHAAAGSGDVETVKYVLGLMPDMCARDSRGRTPFHYAAMSGNVECIEVVANASGPPCLQDADNDGNTAIHLAVYHRKSDAVTHLMTMDPTCASDKNSDGYTPLDIARVVDDMRSACALETCPPPSPPSAPSVPSVVTRSMRTRKPLTAIQGT